MPADVLTTERLRAALNNATAALVAERNEREFWEGELSSSALSTATAVAALAVVQRKIRGFSFKAQIESGLRWLAHHQNADGGWGDTAKSLSNISTTTLCWAAFGAAEADEKFSTAVDQGEQWLAGRIGVASSTVRSTAAGRSALAEAIIARYGTDRTFSVPILTMCAIAGRLGQGREAWRHVMPLPFELATFPHQFFAALRLPVVSYALPALIAIGQVHHVHAPSPNPFLRTIRKATTEKTLRKLTNIQPHNGGFLEATPLTSFVTMSLAASGQAKHIVTQRGVEFLLKSQRADGSWPIDTNLSTWCTTLAVEALPSSHLSSLSPQLLTWLLNQQYKSEHAYTHAAAGGWAWTDLPGGVPDADDTSGALLALAKLRYLEWGASDEEVMPAAGAGIRWLLDLQNSDGGIPTFCRGWGALPFDRSSPDITAHAVRAWIAWMPQVGQKLKQRMQAAVIRAFNHLMRVMEPAGSFAPLWFGNQFAGDDANRTYGTSRVLKAASAARDNDSRFAPPPCLAAGCTKWLVKAQNEDGGWGGEAGIASSVEETALATEALALASRTKDCGHVESVRRGMRWLVERVESGAGYEPSPIGFYFAKLWYFERLYPLIFTVAALRAVSEPVSSVA